MLKGEFTSVDLVNVYAHRCYTIGRSLNLLTEEDYEESLKDAEIKDKERREAIAKGKANELPLLHGIPITVKD